MAKKLDADERAHFEGVLSLLLTPFKEDGAVDWNAYETYVDWQLQWDPTGFFAVCGSSEMKWLSLDERLELARKAVHGAAGKPVVATANLEPDLGAHGDELTRMIDTGISAAVLVPPPGLGEDPAALQSYYARLIEASSIPVFLYEWPLVQPYLLDPTIYGELVRNHGLAGIKDTTCTLEGIRAKIQVAPDALVFQANTPYLVESIDEGARGIMAITSAACADIVIDFWQSMKSGNREEALALHRELVILDAILCMGYPATAKYIAKLRGLPIDVHRRWPIAFPKQVAKAIEVWYGAFAHRDRQRQKGIAL